MGTNPKNVERDQIMSDMMKSLVNEGSVSVFMNEVATPMSKPTAVSAEEVDA